MPQAVMQEESEYPVPAGVPLPAVLQSVKVRTIEFFKKDQYGNKTSEKDSFDKWVWEFKITDGDYAGIKVYGETEDRLSTRADNLVRIWAEQLLGAEIPVGEGLDTDAQLVGLPCIVECRHDEPRDKRDGGKFYPCPVADVFPASGDYTPDSQATQGGWSDEPPF